MSPTLHPMREARPQRSELAVPGSNPAGKEQARKNVIAALDDIDWAGQGGEAGGSKLCRTDREVLKAADGLFGLRLPSPV